MSTFPVFKLSDGTSIPGVGYGVGTAWFAATPDADGVNRPLVEAVKTALRAGYTHLDNAEAYANEASVGQAVKESGIPREQLFITTKIGPGLSSDIRSVLLDQLKKLQTSYVDLYLIHWPYDFDKPGKPSNEDAWKQLEALKDEGLVKSIGVSNYRIPDLKKTLAVAKHRPTVNQIEYQPYLYKEAAELVAFLKAENIAIEAYGPSGPITRFTGGPLDPVLASVTSDVAKRAGHAVEEGQVLLKLASQLGVVVITTSDKESRIKEQLAAGAIPQLTEKEIAGLKEAGGKQYKRAFMKHMELP